MVEPVTVPCQRVRRRTRRRQPWAATDPDGRRRADRVLRGVLGARVRRVRRLL